ncbi:MAG: c-type cytochrome [Nitrospirota bacterium]
MSFPCVQRLPANSPRPAGGVIDCGAVVSAGGRAARLFSFLVLSSLALVSFPNDVFSEEKMGRHLFEHYCAACHGLSGKGDGVNAKHLDPHPANLTDDDIAGRSDQEIYDVILKGGSGVELAPTMPMWGKTFSSDQIASLVSYVRGLQKEVPKPAGVRLADMQSSMGKEQQCAICHIQKGKAKQIAPNLGHEGSKFHKDWLYKFLKDPARVRPIGFIPLTKTKMPNFNLSDEDAGALTAYLSSLKEDRFAPIAPLDRSEKAVSEGETLFSEIYGCDGCHKTSAKGEGGMVGPNLSTTSRRLKPEWIYAWLKNPQSIRPDSPMPNFGLPEADIRYLMAYVLSLGSEGKADEEAMASNEMIEKGKALVEKKNCLFCHTLESASVAVSQMLSEAVKK